MSRAYDSGMWPTVPLKRVASIRPSNVDKHSVEGEKSVRLCNYVDVYRNDRITADMDFMVATAPDAQIDRFTLRADDVLVTKDSEEPTDIGVPAYVPVDLPGVVCGYHLAALRPNQAKVYGGYLAWALRTKEVQAYYASAATGISRYALRVGDLGSTPIRLPRVDEQVRIANFLDEQTARIDALIAEKKDLLALLEEYWASVLSGAMSRAQAFGEQRLRRALRSLTQGWSPVGEAFPAAAEEWGVLKLSAIKQGRFIPGENKALPPRIQVPLETRIRKGDVLLTRANTPELVGSVAYIERDDYRLITSDLIYTLRVNDSVLDPHFLVFYLQSPQARAAIEVDARGSSQSMVKISQGHIRAWRIPDLSLSAQKALVWELEATRSRVQQLREHVEAHIERLHEYRSL